MAPILIFLVFALSSGYTLLTYDEIHSELNEIEKTCRHIMTITTAQELYGLPSTPGCGDEDCIQTIVTLGSNFNKPQVFFSGTVHGNERLGPTTTVEFIRYACNNYDKDPLINHLIDNRWIIIVPMTNAQGYYNVKREEYIDGRAVDINRDFGYQKDSTECMETIGARVTNEIFRHNAIVLGLTFHGGDSVVGYEWGTFNHKKGNLSTEPPDYTGMKVVSEVLSEIADISYGAMTDTVYEVDGGMEDWAYAASWENDVNPEQPITTWNPTTYTQYNITTYNDVSYRQFMFLVEMDNQKIPATARLGAFNEPILTGDGLIPKFVRMWIAAVDFAEPWFFVKKVEKIDGYNKVIFEGRGCGQVDRAVVKYRVIDQSDWSVSDEVKGECFYKNSTNSELSVEFTDQGNMEFLIEGEFDQNWTQQISPDPNVLPQTHMVRARTEEKYNVTYGNDQYLSGGALKSSKVYQISKRPFHPLEQKLTAKLFDEDRWIVANVTLIYDTERLFVEATATLQSEGSIIITEYGNTATMGHGYDYTGCNVTHARSGPGYVAALHTRTWSQVNICRRAEFNLRKIVGRGVQIVTKDGDVIAKGVLQVDGEVNLGEAPGQAVCILEKSNVPITIQNNKNNILSMSAYFSQIDKNANVILNIERSGYLILGMDSTGNFTTSEVHLSNKGVIGHSADLVVNDEIYDTWIVAQVASNSIDEDSNMKNLNQKANLVVATQDDEVSSRTSFIMYGILSAVVLLICIAVWVFCKKNYGGYQDLSQNEVEQLDLSVSSVSDISSGS